MKCQAVTTASQSGEKQITSCQHEADGELCYYHSKVKAGLLTPSSSAIEITDSRGVLWTSKPKPY